MLNISKKVVFTVILLLISQTIFADSKFSANRGASKKSHKSSNHSTHRQKSTYKTRKTQRAPSFNPPSRNYRYDSPNYSRHSNKTKKHRTPSFNPPSRSHNYYRPGSDVYYLPYGSRRIYYNDLEYYFFDGYFYRPYLNEYHVVDSPIGAIVLSLPSLHFSLHWDGMDYFHVGNTYYRRHPRGYVVIRDPGFSRDRWR